MSRRRGLDRRHSKRVFTAGAIGHHPKNDIRYHMRGGIRL